MDTHRFSGPVWSLFRIVVGFLFSLHGAGTVLGLFGGNAGSGQALEVGLQHVRPIHGDESLRRNVGQDLPGEQSGIITGIVPMPMV